MFKKQTQFSFGFINLESRFDLVPGGVGPMTVALLMSNTVLAAQRVFEDLQVKSFNIFFHLIEYVTGIQVG